MRRGCQVKRAAGRVEVPALRLAHRPQGAVVDLKLAILAALKPTFVYDCFRPRSCHSICQMKLAAVEANQVAAYDRHGAKI
jgi:hypothetical protein